jgi:rubredoxin
MGLKSRIKATKPGKPAPAGPMKPSKGFIEPLAEFHQQGRNRDVRLGSQRPPQGPRLANHRCVASWNVQTSPEAVEAFEEVAARVQNVKTLFHGTTAINVVDITQQGLVPGRKTAMFGAGVYFGDIQKASGYGGGAQARYIFEAKVALGTSFKAPGAKAFTLKTIQEQGCHSVHGVAGFTSSWGGTLCMDEYVVYSPDQVLLLRLHEYQISYQPIYDVTPDCGVIRTKPLPSTRKVKAFEDILSQKPCGRPATTKVFFDDGQHRWLCPQCIEEGKLRIGSRVTFKAHSRKGYVTPRIRAT